MTAKQSPPQAFAAPERFGAPERCWYGVCPLPKALCRTNGTESVQYLGAEVYQCPGPVPARALWCAWALLVRLGAVGMGYAPYRRRCAVPMALSRSSTLALRCTNAQALYLLGAIVMPRLCACLGALVCLGVVGVPGRCWYGVCPLPEALCRSNGAEV